MKLLEKENWWLWLLLAFLSGGSSVLVLGALLDVYDKDAWYYRWTKNLKKGPMIILFIFIGIIAMTGSIVLPFMTMITIPESNGFLSAFLSLFGFLYFGVSIALLIFQLQILAGVNAKLKTPGNEIYLSPYIWILGLIIPIIGWIMILVMYLYLQIWYLVMLYRGVERKD